ncbi:MAG TPA: AraC family transcriptional regulator [Ktedonobacteraceae bacterium]|jgi:AraC-like DNA-binding protein|nr:AraC family transcriptional regulator [Ktedonobacteraceae bacterium]
MRPSDLISTGLELGMNPSGVINTNKQANRKLERTLADPFFAEILFDRIPDIVFFVKDVAGRYIVVNETLMQRCGCRQKSQVVGHTPLDLFPLELGARYAEQDQYVITTGRTIDNQLELHLYTDQEPVWCLTYKNPLFDHDGLIIGLAGISRDVSTPDKNHPIYQKIAEVVLHIQRHYGETLRLEELARLANLSVSQLERTIRRIFQLSPKQLIIKTRLEAARHFLKEEKSIADIAYTCGYTDHSAFSRQFKATIGLSPTEYRELVVHERMLKGK